MLLSRNRNTGQILDGPNPITFAGGFFRPFRDDKTPENALLKEVPHPGAMSTYEPIILQFPADSACPATETRKRNAGCDCDTTTKAKLGYWDWTTAFQKLRQRGINLVRVFGMNGVEFRSNGTRVDVYPFFSDDAGKWRVRDAVVGNQFSGGYFYQWLKPFVQAADQNGVAVQFCLFTFHEFGNDDFPFFKYYPVSAWNPLATTPQDWGETNLIPSTVGNNAVDRNIYFTNKTHAITAAQRWWTGCVIQTLSGLGNVILELFNEPRSRYDNGSNDHRVDLADWYDWLVTQILQIAGTWRPLISVNASQLDGTTWDIDTWKALHPSTFNEVDIVSYHGLTGYDAMKYNPCGTSASADFALVDSQNIMRRISAHGGTYGKQALILSTDAVKNPPHSFDDLDGTTRKFEMEKRDGQLQTTTPLPGGTPREDLLEYSDLLDWSTWSLTEAYKPANLGRVHFQNHSIFSASFDRIGAARVAAKPMGQVLGPAYTTSDWMQHSWISDAKAGRNFWWAQRHLVTEGGSVTQLGTVDAPFDPRWEETVETGWRCNFAPAATGWCCFLISYTPVSVSIRSSGATVTPMVIARLHEIVSGNLGNVISRNDTLVGPGAAPGTLVVCGDVVAGRTYALVIAGSVNVNYRNRYQGYGEVIVHFPSIRRLVP